MFFLGMLCHPLNYNSNKQYKHKSNKRNKEIRDKTQENGIKNQIKELHDLQPLATTCIKKNAREIAESFEV